MPLIRGPVRGFVFAGLSALLACSSAPDVIAQAAPTPPPAGPAAPPRVPPPVRSPEAPGAPKFVVIAQPGTNPPADRDGDFIIGPPYLRPRELDVTSDIAQGRVEQFTLASTDSKFFPGIARNAQGTVDPDNPRTLRVEVRPQPYQRAITVYIPAGVRPGQTLAFMVVHDGPSLGQQDQTLPHVLDNLIAQKRVPVMAAVLMQNGGSDAQGSQRGLEYDTVSGKFAEYIEAEVLPAVEKRYAIRLTRDPEKRAVMGCSSGAAAAFTMAWFHPEWYHRVISYSGTFVNQQWPFNPAHPGGAWDYHAQIIANSPVKPIRIWMHVGDTDLLNPNPMRDDMHDWVAANHAMARVLAAKGYHHQYVFARESGHCEAQVRQQTLPEALEYVWRGASP
ncbi:MAG: alpha/beta hydrolase-fold protein [Steroidobacteraceae bacterium]